MKTAVIYARYSSYGQTEQSIEGQVRECTEYAKKNNILILDSYIDRAMTGTNDNRSDFQRMIKASSKRAWDMVLVYKLDRFSRNKYEMAIHRKTLKDNGIRLVSVKENIPDTPEGIILESLLEGMAEYYSVELAQKVMRGQKETRIKGNYCGGGIPYGYTVEKINGNKKYVIMEEEATVVLRIFEEYASGRICREIIDGLSADGIYARDGKPFGRCAIYGILQNERYSGVYRHPRDGVFLNTFPRIIPQPLFDAVRLICENNKIGKNSIEDPYLLRGKIKCGYCSSNVRGDAGTSTTGQVMRYYTCAGRKTIKNKCKKQSLRKEDLEKLVIDITLKAINSAETINKLADKICELNEQRYKTNNVLAILYKEKTEYKKRKDNIMTAMEKGIITDTTKSRLQEVESIISDLDIKIKIEESKEQIKLTKSEILKFLNKAIRKEPAQMIKLLIKQITLYDDKIEIYYNSTERTKPDEIIPHQVFCFYEQRITYDNKAWWYTVKGGNAIGIDVMLFV